MVKRFGGEHVLAGNIIIRQRGTPVRAGANVGTGSDHTLFATKAGKVLFQKKGPEQRMYVSVSAGRRSGHHALRIPVFKRCPSNPGPAPGFAFWAPQSPPVAGRASFLGKLLL